MPARVLVADDSSTMRKIILRSLTAAGVPEAVEAADGDEAVSLFRPGKFDLVLTDSSMPGKNGFEVTKAIRKQDQLVPIIMVASELDRCHALEALEEGLSDFLIKPFSVEAFREKLHKFGC